MQLSEWILMIMDKLGLVGVAFMMFLENVFPPIPSELIMPAAGFASAIGQMSLIGVIIAGTLGSVLGTLPLYYLGSRLDEPRLLRLTERYGKYLLITSQHTPPLVMPSSCQMVALKAFMAKSSLHFLPEPSAS